MQAKICFMVFGKFSNLTLESFGSVLEIFLKEFVRTLLVEFFYCVVILSVFSALFLTMLFYSLCS